MRELLRRFRIVVSGLLSRLSHRVFPEAEGAEDHWQRVALNRAVDEYIGSLEVPTLNAAENVALPLELNGAASDEAEAQAIALLERIGLGQRARAFPDRLSGGEQQRVAIARALVHQPALVLADEPTGNLDVRTGRQVLDLLAELFTDRGSGLLIVTHSLEVARRADRVLTLDDGILQETCPREL